MCADKYDPQGRSDLVGPALRAALSADADAWLRSLLNDPGAGVALVAVGSLGRQELTPRSDVDLVLLHGPNRDVGQLADDLWYPIWDAGVALDHSVRTLAQAAAVAGDDLKAALGLLDARHIGGDEQLSNDLRSAQLARWRADADRRLPQLAAACKERGAQVGELAFLLEPDLKEARGGLRDAQALWQIAATQRADRPAGELVAARSLLLDVRGELHKLRGSDRLALQDQDSIALTLSFRDADALMGAVAAAARAITYALDVTFRRVLPTPARARRGRLRRAPLREPLADGVVSQGGEVVLAQTADPRTDPVLALRVAAAAAHADLPVAPQTLERLSSGAVRAQPWPPAALAAFVATLAAGDGAVRVLEAYDQAGLLTRLLPEWEHTRSHPQRNAYHRFTVDRHLLEAAAHAASLTRRVQRPDLLLLGALLHDIGKGLPGDHTEVGITLVGRIGPRIGLDPVDTATLQQMVRHHLLLADVAQRRDLDDPATITAVARAVGDRRTLELLAALTEADSLATGPAAWSGWKARLLGILVSRVRAVLEGEAPPRTVLTARQEAMLAARVLDIDARGDEVDMACPDRAGVLGVVAGVLALHRLEIRTLTAVSRDGFALVGAIAHPRYGSGPDWHVVRNDLERALADRSDLTARVAERAAAYPMPRHAQAPAVEWVDAGVSEPVLEVRAPDGLGVLHRIATAIAAAGGGVHSARCQTLGADVIDTFTVALGPCATRDAIEKAVLASLESP